MRPSCLSPASRIRLAAEVQRYSTSDDDSGCVMDEYAWVPSGCKPDTIHTYFAALPCEKVPYVNSAGEQWRMSQLKRQLPPQDSDPRYCLTLSVSEQQELNLFEVARKRQCLGKGVIRTHLPYDNQRRYCHQCKQPFNNEDIVIEAPERFNEQAFWHPRCFVCVECTELLVDLIYFKHNNNVFCGRHHAEQLKPRCVGCDELIFSEECTEAEGHVWHMKHFACEACDCQLGGMRYIVKEGRPFCINCFSKTPALLECNTCGQEIPSIQPHITQGDLHWHPDQRCFCCVGCAKNLLGKRYTLIQMGLYCGTNGCERQIRRARHALKGPDPSLMVLDLRPPGPPPPRSPPQPPPTLPSQQHTPPENIYETVALPAPSDTRKTRRRQIRYIVSDESELEEMDSTSSCASSGCCSNKPPSSLHTSKGIQSRNHRNRRSLSMDGYNVKFSTEQDLPYPHDDLKLEELSLKQNRSARRRPQNFYSGMPPDYTTTSDSDSEDEVYLSKCDSISLNLSNLHDNTPKRRFHRDLRKPELNNVNSARRRGPPKPMSARRVKNKTHSNCIVS